MSKAVLLTDVTSIYHNVFKAWSGRKLNYTALKDMINDEIPGDSKLFRCVAYVLQREDDRAIKFIDALKYNGFEVKDRRQKHSRASWCTGILADMFRLEDVASTIYLAVTNPDIIDAFLWAREVGITCILVGPDNVSRDLKEAASGFIEIRSDLLEPGETESD